MIILRNLKLKIPFAMVLVALTSFFIINAAYSRGTGNMASGTTRYTLIKNVNTGSITTKDGKFLINKDTKIVNEAGMEIPFLDIPFHGKARIEYQRVNGHLVALKVWVRKLDMYERENASEKAIPE